MTSGFPVCLTVAVFVIVLAVLVSTFSLSYISIYYFATEKLFRFSAFDVILCGVDVRAHTSTTSHAQSAHLFLKMTPYTGVNQRKSLR